MAKCIFNGSFDPITLGHENIIKRALKIFDEVIIAVMVNESKKGEFSFSEREEMIKIAFPNETRISVINFGGLTVDLCKKMGVNTVIRGVRDEKDYAYEATLDMINKKLFKDFETVYFATNQDCFHISSSAVKELLHFNGDISSFVSKNVENYILNRK